MPWFVMKVKRSVTVFLASASIVGGGDWIAVMGEESSAGGHVGTACEVYRPEVGEGDRVQDSDLLQIVHNFHILSTERMPHVVQSQVDMRFQVYATSAFPPTMTQAITSPDIDLHRTGTRCLQIGLWLQ